jgi:heme A synthase
MRRLLLTLYGIVVGGAYAAALQFAIPGRPSLFPFRGFIIVVFLVWYAWFFAKDRSISTRRLLIEVPLIPIALIGALIAGGAFLAGGAVTGLCSVWRKATGPTHNQRKPEGLASEEGNNNPR